MNTELRNRLIQRCDQLVRSYGPTAVLMLDDGDARQANLVPLSRKREDVRVDLGEPFRLVLHEIPTAEAARTLRAAI